jgi:hypothetical protein
MIHLALLIVSGFIVIGFSLWILSLTIGGFIYLFDKVKEEIEIYRS